MSLFPTKQPTELKSIAEHVMGKHLECNNIVLNLAYNTNRTLDIIKAGSDVCAHIRTEKSICRTCGAFMGHLGYEPDPLLFYKHVNLLVNSVTADNVYVISHRPYPEDYILQVFGMKVHGYRGYNHIRTYSIYNKVSPDPKSKIPVSVFYITQFTKSVENLWASKCILSKKLKLTDFLDGKPTLVINPTKQDLETNNEAFTFYLA
jgi:hypothetical protein